MRTAVLRSLAVVAVGAVALGVLLYVASTIDRRAPAVATISLTQPLPDEPTRALITTSIEVDFSEPIDPETATDVLRIRPRVDGAISWSGSRMLFTPAAPLEPNTSYEVEVEPGARDRAGNPMTDLPPAFAFETAGPPSVVETVPEAGSDEVGLEAPIRLTFSTLMDTASVEAALRLRPAFPHELRWSGRVLEIVPSRPLEADRDYAVDIGGGAIDVAGLPLDDPFALEFRTVAAGLEPALIVPADGSDGIATTTPIVVRFDGPIDPDSASDRAVLSVTPEVAGSLDVVDDRGREPDDPTDGTTLRFTPSAPLPENTTFEVELSAEIMSPGGGLAEAIEWSFTTGAAQPTLSNQIAFLSARSGIANLWAMNPDGSAPRQLSSELAPVLDYAVAPDGSFYVVGDGRSLVFAAAAGTDRRVLTDEAAIEFDVTYSPSGDRIAFARADAITGEGLGIWERPSGGGAATRLALGPEPPPPTDGASASDGGRPASWLRAPRYAPDGGAIAAVDLADGVAILDLESGDRRHIDLDAAAPPVWLSDGASLLVAATDGSADGAPSFDAPVEPMSADPAGTVWLVSRADGAPRRTAFDDGAVPLAVAADGRVAYLAADRSLRIAEGPRERGARLRELAGELVDGASFAPGEAAVVVALLDAPADAPETARLERVDLASGRRSVLVNGGWRPRWLP